MTQKRTKNSAFWAATSSWGWQQAKFKRQQATLSLLPGLLPGLLPPKALIYKGFRPVATVATSFSINLKIIRNIYIYHAYIRLISNIRIYIGNPVALVAIS
jgi:hypothetical protein